MVPMEAVSYSHRKDHVEKRAWQKPTMEILSIRETASNPVVGNHYDGSRSCYS